MPVDLADRVRLTDRRLLGLRGESSEGRYSVVVEPHLCRVDGRFYGGAALAAALASSEALTGRTALWSTVQIVGVAEVGDVIEVQVRSVARGQTIEQVIVTATVDDRLIFQALGSNGVTPRDGMNGQWGSMPTVAPPEASASLADRVPLEIGRDLGHHLACEQRIAAPLTDQPGSGARLAAWARLTGEAAKDSWSTSPAALAFLADLVPLAISEAAGVHGAGASLDNSLRIGALASCDWILIDLAAQLAVDGVGHGQLRIWSPDGHLLAVGSQTARMFTYDELIAKFT